MPKLFKKKQASKETVHKEYTNKELFQALKEDKIELTEQDIQKAGQNDTETLYKIGDAYHKNKDDDKSFAWFNKAALQGHTEAQCRVGDMYRLGQGVFRDYKQAMNLYMEAGNNASAQYEIGKLHHHGCGVPEDKKQAMNWYLKAANNENTNAMHMIGVLYMTGQGVIRDILTAIEWYKKAANKGSKVAQYDLGVIYQYELQDIRNAVYWYQKAGDNGDLNAKRKVKELNEYFANEEESNGNNTGNDQSPTSDQPLNMEKRIDNLERDFRSKVNLMEVKNDTLQKEIAALKRERRLQDQENRLLKETLAKMEDDPNNDLNYDSPDEDATAKRTQNHHPVETYADPDSSEDPWNDIYLEQDLI